jgi:anti-sigma regulatory factor (Ser/Thr protein kinase)
MYDHLTIHKSMQTSLHMFVRIRQDVCQAGSPRDGQVRNLMTSARLAEPHVGSCWTWLTTARALARSAPSRPEPADNGRAPGGFPRWSAWLVRPGGGQGSVAAARTRARADLSAWGAEDRREDVVLVLSEIVANALRHTRPRAGRWPVAAGLVQPASGAGILCAASDPGPGCPRPAEAGDLGESGRGLQIIAALSKLWGFAWQHPYGKVVWAVVDEDESEVPLGQPPHLAPAPGWPPILRCWPGSCAGSPLPAMGARAGRSLAPRPGC